MSWLGRGYESVPGKPFGWAWHQERDEIRAHLRRRLWRFLPRDGIPTSALLESRVSRIQERLHKNKPSYRDRQAAWLARQPKPLPAVRFTEEELARIAEHFAGANDPLAQAIYAKAVRA